MEHAIHIRIGVIFKILLCNIICLSVSASAVVVDSPFGKIRGEIVAGDSSDKSHVVFRNIPYAKPPVGDLRFAKTEPHPKLEGVFDATDKKAVLCIHPKAMLFRTDQGSEDCLVLNIFAKTINPGQKLKKVMVFIHGGAFVAGTAHFYNMSSFVIAHDVIGVTINYRLGILGFLSTGNDVAPGNYGLWDQAMALHWVKSNIKAFGGDPDDVTISGESAGGASVGYQLLSPVTKGLFTKACPQSSTATSVYGRAINVQKHTLTLAKNLKCWDGELNDEVDIKQSEILIECLRKVTASDFGSFMPFALNEPQFVPRVDGDFVPRSPNSLLQDEAYLESIGFYDRSYLVSLTNNEFAIMKQFFEGVRMMIRSNNETSEEDREFAIKKFEDDTRNFYIKLKGNTDDINSPIAKKILDFYDRRNIGDDVLMDMVSDLTFLLPSYDLLNAASKQKKCKSWFLYFNHFPGFMKGHTRGIAHAVDLIYWFDISPEEMEKLLRVGMEGEMDDEELELKVLFSSIIAEFMKNGDPGMSLKEHLPSGWPVYDVTNSSYLNFNPQPTVRSHLEREKRDLWLKHVPKETKETHEHSEL